MTRFLTVTRFAALSVLVFLGMVTVKTVDASLAPVERIPDAIIAMAPENGGAVVVEKSSQRIFYYSYDGAWEMDQVYQCSTGEAIGAKQRAGDKKTPEGVYFFTTEYPDKYLSPIYGTRALPLDYPNHLDRLAGRDGSAIWLHGTNKKLKGRDSNGCVAMRNAEIDRLAGGVELNRTPIIIVDKLSLVHPGEGKAERAEIEIFLSRWSETLTRGGYHDYLAHYDESYLPEIGWWPAWRQFRETLADWRQKLSAPLKGVSIYRQGGDYVVMLDQSLDLAGQGELAGGRKLYLRKGAGGLKIIWDEFRTYAGKGEVAPAEHPLLAAASRLSTAALDEKKVLRMLTEWLSAWSSGDMETYGGFYSGDFKGNGKGRKSWIRHKRGLSRKYKYVRVTMDDLVVRKEAGRCTATFTQTYRSSGYSAVGTKRLELKYEGGRWKIYREDWKKN